MAYYFYPSGQNVAPIPSVQTIPSMKTPGMSNKNDMSRILEPRGQKGGLFIGNISCSQNQMLLKMYQIGAVVTIDKDSTTIRFDSNIIKDHFIMPVTQTSSANSVMKYLHQTVDFIIKAIKQTNVLIHCHSGMRLSSAVATAFLMKNNNVSLQKAFSHVKQCRSVVKIEKQLLLKLKQFYSQCRFPNENNLPKVQETAQSTFTTDSDQSVKQYMPQDNRLKMPPKQPLKQPKFQLTESYQGYF